MQGRRLAVPSIYDLAMVCRMNIGVGSDLSRVEGVVRSFPRLLRHWTLGPIGFNHKVLIRVIGADSVASKLVKFI